jgi:hypothetical protein
LGTELLTPRPQVVTQRIRPRCHHPILRLSLAITRSIGAAWRSVCRNPLLEPRVFPGRSRQAVASSTNDHAATHQ